jgi:hypothetical protein
MQLISLLIQMSTAYSRQEKEREFGHTNDFFHGEDKWL